VRLRTQILLAAVCGATLALSCALLARYVLHGPVDDASLAEAVRLEAGAPNPLFSSASCRRVARSVWMCAVSNDYDRVASTATYVDYRVLMRGGSCWEGRLAVDRSGCSSLPRAISGCVHLWQWSLTSAL